MNQKKKNYLGVNLIINININYQRIEETMFADET